MVSIININYGIKEPTCGYQNCDTSQILIFGGYPKVGVCMYTWVSICVNTILNHIDIYLSLKVLAWYIDPNGIGNTKSVKYPYPTGIKNGGILILYIREWYPKKHDTCPTVVKTPKEFIIPKPLRYHLRELKLQSFLSPGTVITCSTCYQNVFSMFIF